jgi:diguanylate cyclase (GGDEF)-like protein
VKDLRSLLNTVEIFSDLAGDEIDILTSRMKQVQYRKYQTLFQEGDAGNELFLILEGMVRISVKLPDGNELTLAEIEEGNFFGEMSIIERAPRSATCRAIEDGDFLSLHAEDFYDLIRNHPVTAMKIMYRMLNIVSRRLMNTGSLLSEMVRWGEGARKRAITDEFTGLFNRRFLDESLVTQTSRAKAQEKTLSLVMVDLDHFGTLNKTYGEVFCDSIILEASAVFRKVFREKDILARYGGDEFTFILPDTDSKTAQKLCNTVCAGLRKLRFPDHPELIVSSSIGIAALPEDAETLVELKEQADRALYMAKEQGRDRAVTAGSSRTGSRKNGKKK